MISTNSEYGDTLLHLKNRVNRIMGLELQVLDLPRISKKIVKNNLYKWC